MGNGMKIRDGLTAMLELDSTVDVYAEHDIIYAGGSNNPLTDKKIHEKLEKLEWFRDQETDSWAHFV